MRTDGSMDRRGWGGERRREDRGNKERRKSGSDQRRVRQI